MYHSKRQQPVRGRNTFFKRTCRQQPTRKLAKYVRTIVNSSTGPVVSYPRTDPKAIKRDRPFRRLVRLVIANDQTTITANNVSNTESTYYGLTGNRWQSVKFLCVTAYGPIAVETDATPSRLTINSSALTGATTYEDRGDRNHRACIKVILPPTQPAVGATDATAFATFATGAFTFIDVYVEFC